MTCANSRTIVTYYDRCLAAKIITTLRNQWNRKDTALITGIPLKYISMIEHLSTASEVNLRYLAPKHAILKALEYGKNNS